jgi:hypothetical protein
MGHGYRVADTAETVMAFPYEDLPSWDSYEDEFEAQIDRDDAWADLVSDVLSCLSPRWKVETREEWRNGHPGGRILASSGLHELLIEEDRGGYGYAYISVIPRPDLEPRWDGTCSLWPLAVARLEVTASAIFDRLAAMQVLHIPQGYVSSPYIPTRVPSTKRAAA